MGELVIGLLLTIVGIALLFLGDEDALLGIFGSKNLKDMTKDVLVAGSLDFVLLFGLQFLAQYAFQLQDGDWTWQNITFLVIAILSIDCVICAIISKIKKYRREKKSIPDE